MSDNSTRWNGVGDQSCILAATGAFVDLPAIGQLPDRTLAGLIDHTLLKPDATADQVRQLCSEAIEYNFFSVCVNPVQVPVAAAALAGTGIAVCTVIGFPLGATFTAIKVAETRQAIASGANEVDMVLDIGALKAGDHQRVEDDIRAVAEASGNHILKVIFETGLLGEAEIGKAAELSLSAGADFIKTSTGFAGSGATAAAIQLMRSVAGSAMGVKASGGVRDHAGAMEMIRAGASRIGASASIAIVNGGTSSSQY
ncbi:MAG: deoxyribose-phosphate aldolase [Leptospiraceae bacterium]|nr:deoxyribose-phosphate aldolase [Leptospiraceae bacterium]